MCGVAGFWDRRGGDAATLAAIGAHMASRIAHRGPDDQGTWVDPACGVVLAHRRLSIVDPGDTGHQPAVSPCGRYVMAYNGEVYNHLDLRARLQREGAAPAWRGHSDTETLLACLSAWGVARTLAAAVGMFAIALWDRREQSLVLLRDRLGEKPLYYGWHGDAFVFGSELKALLAFPGFKPPIDRGALALLLRHNCVPAPYTILSGVAKLEPGCLLRVRREHAAGQPTPEPYWSVNAAIASARAEPFRGTDEEALAALDTRLRESIRGQLLADVPLGAFLSGGVDSSLVVALMQSESDTPVRTFTIGFGGGEYDEAAGARAVARHLGTAHTELAIGPREALDVIPRLASMYCEPFGDSSQIPTYLVSQLAREHVTVALSGDGGDELFGGYNRYLGARRAWARLARMPRALRQAAAALLTALPPSRWDAAYGLARPLLPRRWRVALPGEKAHKLASVLPLDGPEAFYRALTSHWTDPAEVVIGAVEPPTRVTSPASWPEVDDMAGWMMAMDAQTYLPDDILVKVDRAAMANSLETRVPFLDHRVFEFAWRLPMHLKIRDGEGKWLPRQLLDRHVPRALVDGPKMGFGVPIDAWLRGALRAWAETLLDPVLLRRQGLFHPEPVLHLWQEHLSGRRNHQHRLWTLLMFQAWLLEYHAPAAAGEGSATHAPV